MITKALLAKELQKSGLSYRKAALYLDEVVKALAESLSNGENIQLRGLGTFSIKTMQKKVYPSLLSGTKIIPAHGRIVFRPCRELKQAVWDKAK